MMDAIKDFEWWKDSGGYRLIDAVPPDSGAESLLAGAGSVQRIVRNGGALIRYRPFANANDNVAKRFAYVRTPLELLKFIERFGLLTKRGWESGQIVEGLLLHAQTFLKLLMDERRDRQALLLEKEGETIGSLGVSLVADRSGRVRLRVMPDTLLSGLYIQLAETLAEGPKIARCKHCGELFNVGGKGRRLVAKFCSDDHRIKHNSLQRSIGPMEST
jgi:hypothetical protein